MPTCCTVCDQTGFVNLYQINDYENDADKMNVDEILDWIALNEDHEVSVCHCCGDGQYWYGTPGEHYNSEDPSGPDGPYASNGGFCRCH